MPEAVIECVTGGGTHTSGSSYLIGYKAYSINTNTVLGGDHLTDGIEAIQTAIANPVLRPHFAQVESKRLAERFGKRKADLKAAAKLIDDSSVMSPAEINKKYITFVRKVLNN